MASSNAPKWNGPIADAIKLIADAANGARTLAVTRGPCVDGDVTPCSHSDTK